MPDLNHLLDQIDRLDHEAEAGPWDHEREVNTQNGWSLGTVRSGRTGESVAPEVYDPDGEFIALARTALPQLAEALRGVLDVLDDYTMPGKLHDPTGIAGAELESLEGYTREAITDALGDDND